MQEPKAIDLISWYDHNKRDLPWRSEASPYTIWLSEIMLQQTRVETVIDYFTRFVSTFPDIFSLARASEDELLRLWQGLGYYSRARNLHKTAKIIAGQRQGEFPETVDELKKLPGIGDYTAAAIASMAFNKPEPAIDGNLLRIFSRLEYFTDKVLTARAKKEAYQFFKRIMAKERPGDFNQALMDLGSMICLPKGDIHCSRCPWQKSCKAHSYGKEIELPKRGEKKRRKLVEKTILLLFDSRQLVLQKRPSDGLLAGLYEFPHLEGRLTKKELEGRLGKAGLKAEVKKLPKQRHLFSHLEWQMQAFAISFSRLPEDILKSLQVIISCEKQDPALVSEAFVTTFSEMEEVYSIPSAFRFFEDYLLT